MRRIERNTPLSAATEDSAEEGVDPLLLRQKHLSAQLRAAFAHVAEEPVPDDFLELIDRLDAAASPPNGGK